MFEFSKNFSANLLSLKNATYTRNLNAWAVAQVEFPMKFRFRPCNWNFLVKINGNPKFFFFVGSNITKYTSHLFYTSNKFFILELSRKFYFQNIFVSSDCNQSSIKICIYFEIKFDFIFRSVRMFEVRQRKFSFTRISRKCVCGTFF